MSGSIKLSWKSRKSPNTFTATVISLASSIATCVSCSTGVRTVGAGEGGPLCLVFFDFLALYIWNVNVGVVFYGIAGGVLVFGVLWYCLAFLCGYASIGGDTYRFALAHAQRGCFGSLWLWGLFCCGLLGVIFTHGYGCASVVST